jgi:hypothetical protein
MNNKKSVSQTVDARSSSNAYINAWNHISIGVIDQVWVKVATQVHFMIGHQFREKVFAQLKEKYE